MEMRQLRYFLDIAQTEHLTLSARHLFVTQSTLSHGLRQLEQELGVSLFDRVGRGLKLSQAGLAFRDHALRALKELEAGRMALSELNGLQSGRLTVGVFPTFLNTLVPATVAAFSQAYPGVTVEVRDLRAGPIEEQVLSGELDLGIAFHPATSRPSTCSTSACCWCSAPPTPGPNGGGWSCASWPSCPWPCCRAASPRAASSTTTSRRPA